MDQVANSPLACGEACPFPPGGGIDRNGHQFRLLLGLLEPSGDAKRPLKFRQAAGWLYRHPESARGGCL